jgi:hypothetical protein
MHRRWWLYGGLLVGSLLLAFVVRDVARDVIITPLAYLAWRVQLSYWAIPGLAKWAAVILVVSIGVIWQLLPESKSKASKRPQRIRSQGEIESLALWISKTRNSNYFKWQVANRLGRIARRLEELSGRRLEKRPAAEQVRAYLSAGVDHSFADFPGPRNRFERRAATPLDLQPGVVVEFLESQMELDSGRHPKSL